MRLVSFAALAASFLFLAVSLPATASIKMIPFKATIGASGNNAHRIFRVTNASDYIAAVQVTVTTRDIDINGVETSQEDEDNFIIYPAQIILKPREERSIRVQWVGDPDIPEEQAYRLVVEQLPVDLEAVQDLIDAGEGEVSQANVEILVRYLAALYVAPAGSRSDVVLESHKVVQKNDQPHIELVFYNRGNAHQNLTRIKLRVTDDVGKEVTILPEDLATIAGENLLPGKKRRFTIPYPKGLSGGVKALLFDIER